MGKIKANQKTLKGFCFFHSETGTEGGYWAFQDERHIKKGAGCALGYCKNCGKWMRPQDLDPMIARALPIIENSCPEGACVEKIGDAWSYEGLFVLKDGDRLTIFSKDNPNEVVWSGIIKLRQYPLFTKNASGFWIHADQKGVKREAWARWFFEEYPATLVTAQTFA